MADPQQGPETRPLGGCCAAGQEGAVAGVADPETQGPGLARHQMDPCGGAAGAEAAGP